MPRVCETQRTDIRQSSASLITSHIESHTKKNGEEISVKQKKRKDQIEEMNDDDDGNDGDDDDGRREN